MKFVKVLKQYTTCNVVMSNLSFGVSQKYASSILNTTANISELEIVISELQLIRNNLSIFSDLWSYLCNQWISSKEKLAVFERISQVLKVSQFTLSVVNLMITHHRLALIENVITQLEVALYSMKDSIKVEISTAKDLDDATQSRITEDLKSVFNLKIVPEFSIDQSLIGGFIAYSDTLMLDLSFKGRINQLKKEFKLE